MSADVIVLLILAVVAALFAGRAIVGSRRQLPGREGQRRLPEKDARADEAAAAEERRRAALRAGLSKTRGGFVSKLSALFKDKQIDASTMDHLEEVLIGADIGVRTSGKIFEAVKKNLSREQLADAGAIWTRIREESARILDVGAPPLDLSRARPFVILVIGVNGAGKTTTIGKLAAKYAAQGKKVLLAAGDTFRAAATEQLEIWGQRTGCPVVKGKEGGDPSSVIFDAVKRAQAEGFDVVLADTAGRLQTKTNLMEEIQKVRRETGKAHEGAPHEVFLVLDSTNGQNAIAQATVFQEALGASGIVLTKLDGTAKGGVVLGITDELKIPVRYVGIGEKVDDLREFDAADFIAALYDVDEESAAA